MDTLAVAGLSARCMAEAAAGDGFEVVALDLFGDVDTCAVASRWFGIGEPARLCIDDARLLQALALLARQGRARGWVAGSGFDGRADLLARGAELLPLIGMAPQALARLRDPQTFFAFLHEHDIEHPPVRCGADAASGTADGRWLLKDFGASGGWHIRPAATPAAPLRAGEYLQREVPGQPMSATFVANGHAPRLLGVNQQIVRAVGSAPYVYAGVIGPVAVAPAVLQRLQDILRTLTAGFALRGLASLDFLLDGGHVLVLEVNARPSASMALYPGWQPMAAHVQACLRGGLPSAPAAGGPLHGQEIVYARRPLQLAGAQCRWLAGQPDVHDLPAAGQHLAAGDPLCSVSASGDDIPAVLGRLQQRREALLQTLETGS